MPAVDARLLSVACVMTFIVRKHGTTHSGAPKYDFVDGAEDAAVTEAGHLTLRGGRPSNRVLAVYAPGEWISAFRDGSIRQSDGTKIFEPLTTENLSG